MCRRPDADVETSPREGEGKKKKKRKRKREDLEGTFGKGGSGIRRGVEGLERPPLSFVAINVTFYWVGNSVPRVAFGAMAETDGKANMEERARGSSR